MECDAVVKNRNITPLIYNHLLFKEGGQEQFLKELSDLYNKFGVDWALNQNEEIKKLIEDNDYNKGYQDAIEKAKQIIISFMPLPSNKNHNINSDLELLKAREQYAKQVAKRFEEMMIYDR